MPTRSISSRDQPCGLACVLGEQHLCSTGAGWMPPQGAKPPFGTGTYGFTVLLSALSEEESVQPNAQSYPPGKACPAGWGVRLCPLENGQGTRCFCLCPWEGWCGQPGQPQHSSALAGGWNSLALPAQGDSTMVQRKDSVGHLILSILCNERHR